MKKKKKKTQLTFYKNIERTGLRWLVGFYGLIFQKFNKPLLFSRNQLSFLKNWKLWRVPITVDFNNFCWNFVHISCLPLSTKGCSGFFKILFRNWVICQNKKDVVFTHSQKPGLSIIQDLNRIKKIPNTLL